MNYVPLRDGRRMVESAGANLYEIPHNIPPLLMSFVMTVWKARKHLAGCACDIALAFVKPPACARLSYASSGRVTWIFR